MKVERITDEFDPFSIKIRFDSLLEAQYFRALFNHSGITNYLEPHVNHEAIRDVVCVTGGDAHNELCKALR